MELSQVKKIIKNSETELALLISRAETANRYYDTENDILFDKKTEEKEQNEKSALRNANNRVCSSWYPLLVDQKNAYIFTYPPLFDVGSIKANKKIKAVLGEKFQKICQKLCLGASNETVAWVHYWINKKGEFRYGVLSGTQVIPVFSDDIEQELLGVLRVYRKIESDGNTYVVYEIWNDKQCEAYHRKESESTDSLCACYLFEITDTLTNERVPTNVYTHSFGEVPFIPFYNNAAHKNDLMRIKGLIDSYDKTFNGFMNDLEDIQEVIMVLTGYSGTKLADFIGDLKKYKAIKLDDADSGSVKTLNIEIPVEARKEMLELCKKAIFIEGQGVDPDPQNFGDASGVALEFLYSLLELKAGNMQTEFTDGFSRLVRAICKFYNIKIKDDTVQQTWTRNAIRNDKECSEIVKNSVGTVSEKTLLKNHPLVEDADAEITQLQKERSADDVYNGAFKTETDDGDEE